MEIICFCDLEEAGSYVPTETKLPKHGLVTSFEHDAALVTLLILSLSGLNIVFCKFSVNSS
jgi:hypothetical protein